ncbi:MAG TPA: hypothetical protein VHL08_04615 [Dongiaceae bacterium]|nr:hypothetical protein [Dongiaceae bacterium]
MAIRKKPPLERGEGEARTEQGIIDYILSELGFDDRQDAETDSGPAEDKSSAPDAPEWDDESTPDSGEDPTFSVQIGGEARDVPLSDLIASYRDKVSGEDAMQDASQSRDEAMNQLAAVTRMLKADPSMNIDAGQWQRLAQADPELFSQLHGHAVLAGKKMAMARELHNQMAEEELAQRKRQAQANFVAAAPEFRDPEKRQRFEEDANAYLTSLGLTPEEADRIPDHRIFLMIKDALEGQKLKQAAQSLKAKKQPFTASRTQKPGVGDDADRTDRAIRKLKQQALASGKLDDIVKLAEAVL